MTNHLARPVQVWHIGAWNRNIGDWALAHSMHRLLNEQAHERGLHLCFSLVDSQRTKFHPALVDQMNEEADLILVGGGGLIFFRTEDQSVSGWSFNIAPADLERLRPPVVVYGIGYNRFAYDPSGFPEATGPHLRQLQAKAALFSVRNQGTRQALVEQFGLDPAGIDVIPDPAIRLYDRPIEVPARRGLGPIIAINWAGDRPQHRYPAPAEANAQYFFDVLRQALRRCVEQLDAQVMFLPHLNHVDTDEYEAFAADFPTGTIFSTHLELPFLYPPPGELLAPHVPFFTNVYRQAGLVLTMRFHSAVLAFGAGTPFLRIGSHPKLRYFVAETGVPDYALDLQDRDADTVETVFQRITACLGDASYRPALAQALGQQTERLRRFNERVLDLFGEPVKSREADGVHATQSV